jgi:hypothetical protein
MDAIEMTLQITLIPDHVIPESLLPQAERPSDTVRLLEVQRGVALNTVEHLGEVAAFLFNSHQPVKMIGQDDVGEKTKGMNARNASQGIPEQVEVGLGPEIRRSITRDTGDEYDGVGNVVASEVGNGGSLCFGGYGNPPYIFPSP